MISNKYTYVQCIVGSESRVILLLQVNTCSSCYKYLLTTSTCSNYYKYVLQVLTTSTFSNYNKYTCSKYL